MNDYEEKLKKERNVKGASGGDLLFYAAHPELVPIVEAAKTRAETEVDNRFKKEDLGRHNGDPDAFRHAYFTALIARRTADANPKGFDNSDAAALHGLQAAKRATDAHETFNKLNPLSKDFEFPKSFAEQFSRANRNEGRMDRHNNSIGLEIVKNNPHASDEELASFVQQALNNGELKSFRNLDASSYDNLERTGNKGLKPILPEKGEVKSPLRFLPEERKRNRHGKQGSE